MYDQGTITESRNLINNIRKFKILLLQLIERGCIKIAHIVFTSIFKYFWKQTCAPEYTQYVTAYKNF